MSEQFQVGDIVQLKSGGPAMVIAETARDGFQCNWFNEKESKIEKNFLYHGTLQKYVPKKIPSGAKQEGFAV